MTTQAQAAAVVADLLAAQAQRDAIAAWVTDRRARYPTSRVASQLARILTTDPLPEETAPMRTGRPRIGSDGPVGSDGTPGRVHPNEARRNDSESDSISEDA